MNIRPGMHCVYIDAFGSIVNDGIVVSIKEDKSFTVTKNIHCSPQYNDYFTDFKPEDLGKKVFIFPESKEDREEMSDDEKTITAFSLCISTYGLEKCLTFCPYYGHGDIPPRCSELTRDVLNLLVKDKEQIKNLEAGLDKYKSDKLWNIPPIEWDRMGGGY